ncbi:conserved hypothetical protein [Cupriavidus taiwanensis]|uniref:phage adaptor protein n=1 Tax=Cupriavidus taiwanensis TaxID=164546 RepID=UPI000E16ACA4|nr:hypothetical protein [Cupriavidus taiwanensis]SOY79931.1 conserved hypothetical protein [Cupriavidus taiwanensis]SOY81900.1 conserved hypothetical protein [Cupriavidus taiwanensis]
MIQTYDDLKAAIGRWLHRSDLAVAAEDFITLFEVRINRNLRVRQMEASLSQTISAQTVALPADWLEFIGKPTLGGKPQDFITRDQYKTLDGLAPVFEQGYFSIFGSNLKLGADVSAGVTLAFDYYAKIPSLSASAQTNWLIVDAPDVYLYGALLEAEPYLKNDPRLVTWQGLLTAGIDALQTASDKAKTSGGTLEIR